MAADDSSQLAPMNSNTGAVGESRTDEVAVQSAGSMSESIEDWSDSVTGSDDSSGEREESTECSCEECEDLRLVRRGAEHEQGEDEANPAAPVVPGTPDWQEAAAPSPTWQPDAPQWRDEVIILSSDDE